MKPKHRSLLNSAIQHNKKNEQKKSFHITYRKQSTGRVVKRKVSPYEIKGGLLVAYDHKRKSVRTYRTERISHMKKTAFWQGFEKKANHAAEVAGLGLLAIPSIQHLRGKPMSEDTAHKIELGGLGILAAPSVAHLGGEALKYMKGAKTLGRLA